jgi:hypothetical protein
MEFIGTARVLRRVARIGRSATAKRLSCILYIADTLKLLWCFILGPPQHLMAVTFRRPACLLHLQLRCCPDRRLASVSVTEESPGPVQAPGLFALQPTQL